MSMSASFEELVNENLDPHQPVTDEEWQFFQDEAYLVKYDMPDPEAFADKVRQFRRVFGGPKRARRSRQFPAMMAPGLRERVLADLLAAEARQNDAVQAYRQKELAGELLRPEEVEAWVSAIRRAPDREGSEVWVTDAWVPRSQRDKINDALGEVYEEDEEELEPLLQRDPYLPGTFTDDSILMPIHVIIDAARIERHESLHMLRYTVRDAKTGDMRVKSVVTGTGPLERLRQLSTQLAETYGWDAADAATFVLTDLPPRVAAITAQTSIDEQTPVHSRIILTIDPTLTPATVASYYLQVRKQVLGRRYRALTPKHLELARFAVSRPKDEPGAQRVKIWNDQVPAAHRRKKPREATRRKKMGEVWAYDLESNFTRDSKRAQERLLHPDLHLPPDEE